MKRTSLTTAVVAGIAGVAGFSNMASAVFLNPDAVGSVLVYPYYGVQANNETLFSVVNTTAEGKAVKVRFLEAYNSREVLDFNLYLSPFDVWVGEVVSTGDSPAPAGLLTNDNSCTVPAITGTVPFRNFAYNGQVGPTDGGPTGLDRTREGYVELIEMGTVTNATNSSLRAITHVGGVPASCGQVVGAWGSGGYWTTAPDTDIGPPDGGLFGSASVINVARGTIEGYNADAIDQFYAALTPPQHTPPTSLLPSIASATSLTSFVFENGQLATSTYAFGVDAVSSIFMVDSVYNEYVTEADIGASTEWVVTFPTKRFYVDPAIVGITAIPPFDVVFSGTSCSPVSLQFWNREEATSTSGTDFSPSPTVGTSLCFEAQVVTFNQTGGGAPSTILGDVVGSPLGFPANIDTSQVGPDGWALLNFTLDSQGNPQAQHQLTAATNGNVFVGLPTTGFSVNQFINADVGGGILANYTGLYRHKFHRTCINAANVAGGGACS